MLELPQGSPASQERIPQPCCHRAAVLTRHSPVVTGQQPLAGMASHVEMDLSSSWALINPSLKSVGSKRTIYKQILIPTLLFKRKISGCFNKVLIIKPGPKERSWLIPIEVFSSVAQVCPTLCDPMDCSIPGLPVHQQLLELAQTHVHQVGDAIP